MAQSRKRLGLPVTEIQELSPKMVFLKTFYDAVSFERDYVVVSYGDMQKTTPKVLAASQIEPYYTLTGADELMDYAEFFDVVRIFDKLYLEALQQHQAAQPRRSK